MKEQEKQRKFHEALLKMLYPPPSPPPSDKNEAEDSEAEANLIKSLNDLPEEEMIEKEEVSPSSSDDNESGGDGKLTRAQRKRLRKRKLKEAASCRRKIIGPLLPASGDLSHGGVEVLSKASEGAGENGTTNFSEEEAASCSNKNKLKLKLRRKSKKVVAANSTPSSTTTNRN